MILFKHKLINSKTAENSKLTPEQFTEGILMPDALYWWEGGQKKSLILNNVVGAAYTNKHKEFPELVINSYLLIQKRFVKAKRILQEDKFLCLSDQARREWLMAIHNALYSDSLRHFHIILNPQSGSQKGELIFKQVTPLLTKSNLSWKLTRTLKSGDAKEQAKNINIEQIDGFIIIGGDGTIHEIINGLMSRDDWEIAIKKPMGIIPAGTGNGLCKTLLELAGEPYDPISAAFLIAKGKQHPIDLAIIEQNQHRYYSILSVSWGLPSDVDIESEAMRYLGGWRNYIYTLFKIIFLRSYQGEFSFLLHSNLSADSGEHWQTIEGKFILFWAMNLPWATYDLKISPLACLNDKSIDVLIVREKISKLLLLRAFLKGGDGSHINLPGIEYYKVKQFYLKPENNLGILSVDGEKINNSPIKLSILENVVVSFFSGSS